MKDLVRDLVQVDIDTALALYLKGYTHIPVLQRDGYSSDWSSMQPLYLDDVLANLMAFASDSKRAELLNPPKVDIKTVKEDIAMEYKPRFRIDPEEDEEDDDPDWVEAEPEQVESIPDDDEVPERERIPYKKPEVITVEQAMEIAEKAADNAPENMKAYIDDTIEDIEAGRGEPLKWNIRDAIRYREKAGISTTKLGKVYGVSPQTVINRINQFKMK
jgi:hypothetical protein